MRPKRAEPRGSPPPKVHRALLRGGEPSKACERPLAMREKYLTRGAHKPTAHRPATSFCARPLVAPLAPFPLGADVRGRGEGGRPAWVAVELACVDQGPPMPFQVHWLVVCGPKRWTRLAPPPNTTMHRALPVGVCTTMRPDLGLGPGPWTYAGG